MEQQITKLVLVLLGAVFLLYPFIHMRNIIAGRAEYRGPRSFFLVTWALISAGIILQIMGSFVLSLF